eukprot:TRINITY_DN56367_c0_g1_i1.p1 TRINITY_DN56367_c0_g1~~TRINITY_DN56367_c0_g1_i1.p1  ORF type:complete len:190 (+),score=17.65 TRINITY_DN56367_c0_g1_i1:78-647(+)
MWSMSLPLVQARAQAPAEANCDGRVRRTCHAARSAIGVKDGLLPPVLAAGGCRPSVRNTSLNSPPQDLRVRAACGNEATESIPMVEWWNKLHGNKSELIDILQRTKTRKEQDRIVHFLRQIEPSPNYDLDGESGGRMVTLRSDNLRAFMCFRCDRVWQSYYKVQWTTSQGVVIVCHGCFKELVKCRSLA